MTAIAVFNDLSCGPIQGSTKVYRELPDGGKVPFRRVNLTTGDHLDLYDTSGPYTDPDATIDLADGLPRRTVTRDRGSVVSRSPASIRCIAPIRRASGRRNAWYRNRAIAATIASSAAHVAGAHPGRRLSALSIENARTDGTTDA